MRRRNHRIFVEMHDQLQQVIDRNPDARHQTSFFGIHSRDDQRPLAQAFDILQRNQRHLPAGDHQTQRNRDVKPNAIFGQINRGQMKRDIPRWYTSPEFRMALRTRLLLSLRAIY